MSASRSCMRQIIRDALLRAILDGEYAPGDRLLELHVARRFETSQAPVREALRELEAMRYVETIPYRGTRVREVPLAEIREACRLRAILEREAAVAAAVASDDGWDEMRAAVDALEAAAADGDLKEHARNDEAFHHALVTRSGNSVLLCHWRLLLAPTRVALIQAAGGVDVAGAAAEHRPILEALERADAELAGRLAFEHSDQVARNVGRAAAPKGA